MRSEAKDGICLAGSSWTGAPALLLRPIHFKENVKNPPTTKKSGNDPGRRRARKGEIRLDNHFVECHNKDGNAAVDG